MPGLELYMVMAGTFLGVQLSDAELFKPQIHFSPDSLPAATPPSARQHPDTGASLSGGRKKKTSVLLSFSLLLLSSHTVVPQEPMTPPGLD